MSISDSNMQDSTNNNNTASQEEATMAVVMMTPEELSELEAGPFAGLLPSASESADESLGMSICESGVLNAIILYRDAEGVLRIADGLRRRSVAVDLGADCPVRVIDDPGDEELRRIRCVNSVDWRGIAKGEMVRHFLEVSQAAAGLSCERARREVKALFGLDVSRQTIHNQRRGMEGDDGESSTNATVEGANGRQRSSQGRRGSRPTVTSLNPNADTNGVDEAEVAGDLAGQGFPLPERGSRSEQELDGDTSEFLSLTRLRLKELLAFVPEDKHAEADGVARLVWHDALEVCRTQARAASAIDDTFWKSINAQWATIKDLRVARSGSGSENQDEAAA